MGLPKIFSDHVVNPLLNILLNFFPICHALFNRVGMVYFFKSSHEIFFAMIANPHLISYVLPPDDKTKLKVLIQF